MPLKPRFGLDGTTSAGEQYARDLDRAAGFKPILQEDINKALKPYGQKFGQVPKGASDDFLYQKATKTVVDWYKKNNAKKLAGPAPSAGGAKPAPKTPSQPVGNMLPQGPSNSGSSANSATPSRNNSAAVPLQNPGPPSALLPNTPLNAPVAPPPRLVPMPELTPDMVRNMLRASGLNVNPPAYALRNLTAFQTWLANMKRS